MATRLIVAWTISVAAFGQAPTRPDPVKYPFAAIGAELSKDPASAKAVVHGDPRAELQARAARAVADAPVAEEAIPTAAQDALKVAEPWKADRQRPAPGKDGRVLYTFGAGMATVVCAPLRVCVLELQSGEQVVGEPHIGDAVRWSIAPAISGAGNSATNLVVIKPKEAGLDTNLVIPTNRRSYYVRLVSRSQDYIPLVAFSYPDDEIAQWRKAAAAQKQVQEEAEATQLTPVESISNLNFDYQVSGGTEFLRPLRVLDDGKKTYIQMPDGTAVREAPVLVVAGLDHSAEMVNYRVKGSMYIVDRLFDRGALLLGAGKKQERVDIIRGGKTSKDGAKASLLKKKDPIDEAYRQLKRTPAEPAAEGAKTAEPAEKLDEK